MSDSIKEFGYSMAEELQVGDIVSWSNWSEVLKDWQEHIGILMKVENEVHETRMVSVSRVLPLDDQAVELKFFTFTLRLVSRSYKENKS